MSASVYSIKKILLLPLFILSCQTSNNKDMSQIRTFDLRELPKISEIKLSDLGFVDIEYIPLETNDQSSMGRFGLRAVTDRFIVGNDFYIIKQFNTILMFLNDGTFKTRIGTLGRGPTEFQGAHDIDITGQHKYIK